MSWVWLPVAGTLPGLGHFSEMGEPINIESMPLWGRQLTVSRLFIAETLKGLWSVSPKRAFICCIAFNPNGILELPPREGSPGGLSNQVFLGLCSKLVSPRKNKHEEPLKSPHPHMANPQRSGYCFSCSSHALAEYRLVATSLLSPTIFLTWCSKQPFQIYYHWDERWSNLILLFQKWGD